MAATTLDAPVAAAADGEDDVPPPSVRPWWDRLDLWTALLVVAACCAFVFVELDPHLLLRDTTVLGGDNAAHVWFPAYLRDHLLPWRLAGWSPDFYAGFPAGQFYFPIPALLIVALDVVLPYNVAFKLITASGPVLLPLAAYIFGRGIRAPRPAPALMAVAATAFLFFNGDPGTTSASSSIAFNQHIMGGTLASTLAGEYSFTIALAFSLACFGTLAWSLRTGRRMWIPALLLALAVMSHLVVAVFAVAGALVVWLASRPIRHLGRAASIGLVGGLLTAVWTLPLVATLKYTTDMRYTPITEFTDYLFPKYVWGVEGLWPWQWGATLLIACALTGAVICRRRSTVVLVMITALFGLLFRVWEDLQATPAWNLRFLPFWYLGLFLLMAAGAAEVIRAIAWGVRHVAKNEGFVTPPRLLRGVVIAGVTVVLALGTLVAIDSNKDFLPYWIRWNYRGAEDSTGDGATPAKASAEYQSFIETAGKLPAGRLHWEGNSQINAYGSPLALMLLPYWTHGKISSMEGVYYEASATTPYHFMAAATLAAPGNASNAVVGVPYKDFSEFHTRGVRYLQLMGVRYLAVHSIQSKAAADADDRLRLVATVPDLDTKPPNGWSIYEVADSEIVAPLAYQPVVVDHVSDAERRRCEERERRLIDPAGLGRRVEVHDWQDCIAVPWFDDVEALDRPLVAEGPASWQHAGPAAGRAAAKEPLPKVRVSHIRQSDDTISFRVSRTGVPVVVKASWFPNWTAEGADGPYRATPNLMVVVPTQRQVTLHYGTTTAEWLGRLGTLAGIIGLVLLAAWPRIRRRRPARAAARTPDLVPGDDPAPPGAAGVLEPHG